MLAPTAPIVLALAHHSPAPTTPPFACISRTVVQPYDRSMPGPNRPDASPRQMAAATMTAPMRKGRVSNTGMRTTK